MLHWQSRSGWSSFRGARKREPGIQMLLREIPSSTLRVPRNDRSHQSPRQIRELRMLVQVIRDKTAAGDDLQSVGADQLQRAVHQFGGDAAAAQISRRLGVGDD